MKNLSHSQPPETSIVEHIKILEARVAFLEKMIAGKFPHTIAAYRISIVETIQEIVCDATEISKDRLISLRRHSEWVWARHMAMAFSYEFSGLSTSRIAPLFNRLDHSTVLHAVVRVRHEETFRHAKGAEVRAIRSRVREALNDRA